MAAILPAMAVVRSVPVDDGRPRPAPVDDASGTGTIRVRVARSETITGRNGRSGQCDGRPTMGRFEVDSDQVTKASAAVQLSADHIRGEVDGMMRHLIELQASWKGQAASSFQHVLTDWGATQERVRGALEDLRKSLALAGQQYAEAELAASRMFTPR
jgi:6 kDa early secretory antigenic target